MTKLITMERAMRVRLLTQKHDCPGEFCLTIKKQIINL